MGDEIAGLDAGAIRRGIGLRGDDFDCAILHRHRQAEPAIFAIGLGAQRGEIARVEIARMRIERSEHSFDRPFDQAAVLDRFDIVRLHFLKHVHETGEFGAGTAFDRSHRTGGERNGEDHRHCRHRAGVAEDGEALGGGHVRAGSFGFEGLRSVCRLNGNAKGA